MIKYLYSSNFSNDINSLIIQKQALGFVYEGSQRILKHFDELCRTKFPQETVLTRELCMTWAVRKDKESNSSFCNRMMPVRELARHILRQGRESYIIPTNLTPKSPKFVPYIYTIEELRILFSTLDKLQVKQNFPVRHLVIPMFFRLIYCCGLRPGEARKLKVNDFNFDDGYFVVLESKGHKDRIIYPSEDVLKLLMSYNEKVGKIIPNRNFFFPDSKDMLYTRTWASQIFREQWKKSGLLDKVGKTPRIYDLRHTFATHRLYLWMNEGKDITAFLPYLSTYMGHANFTDTLHYIHLTPNIFETMSDFNYSKRENLLLEVIDNGY